jgi:hypothetical protein
MAYKTPTYRRIEEPGELVEFAANWGAFAIFAIAILAFALFAAFGGCDGCSYTDPSQIEPSLLETLASMGIVF